MAAAAGPGGAHEDTLLLVWGDHGQTDQGDHGGGTPAEVCSNAFHCYGSCWFAVSKWPMHAQGLVPVGL